jgi:hypothetical protein
VEQRRDRRRERRHLARVLAGERGAVDREAVERRRAYAPREARDG